MIFNIFFVYHDIFLKLLYDEIRLYQKYVVNKNKKLKFEFLVSYRKKHNCINFIVSEDIVTGVSSLEILYIEFKRIRIA